MSLFAQIGIVILIILTGLVLFMANRGLAAAEREGEHFVDEWALRQQKKAAGASLMQNRQKTGERKNRQEKKMEEKETSLTKEEDSARRLFPADHPIYLTMLDDEKNLVKRIKVDQVPYRIGRDGKNDLVLNDLSIAREHAEILEEKGEWILRDLGTANKIYAEGTQCKQYPLREQNRFYLGHYEFRVEGENHRSQPTTLAAGKERMPL